MAGGCNDSRCSCVIVDSESVTWTGSGRGDNPFAAHTAAGGAGGASGWAPGDLKWTARATPETGWLVADGSPVSRAAFPALFDAIGEQHGPGDGVTTFNLPNLLDRFVLGSSPDRPVGTIGGASQVTLSAAQLPAHAHSINHNHGAATSNTAGQHDHELQRSENPGGDNVSIPAGQSRVTATGRAPILGDGAHQHTVNVGPYTGTSGSTGDGAPLGILPPYFAGLPLIKT